MSASSCLAVFDLDGTLVREDTCARFLRHVLWRRPSSWLRLPVLARRFASFATGRCSSEAFKEAAFCALLGGMEPARLEALARAFAARTAQGLRPGALRRLDGHRRAGDRLVLATASPDIYVDELARLLGMDGCVRTRLERAGDRTCTGRLLEGNCKGPGKLRALETWLEGQGGREAWTVIAYSDHADDLPLLTWADKAVAVNPGPSLRKEAAERGWAVEDWS